MLIYLVKKVKDKLVLDRDNYLMKVMHHQVKVTINHRIKIMKRML